MPEIISDTSLAPVRLNNSELVVQNDSGHYNPIDLEEYNNRELVNLENAAVNIENSSDVIIGPVTQFNVNGNVTIFQNGQEAVEGESVKKEETSNGSQHCQRSLKQHACCFNRLSRRHQFLIVVVIIFLWIGFITVIYLLQTSPKPPEFFGECLGSHRVYYREDWGGVPNISSWALKHPTQLVIISHTESNFCNSFDSCSMSMRELQDKDIKNKWSDIGYNFLIGGDGNVYVGRGWDAVNFHPQFSIGISFIGNYFRDNLTAAMVDVALLLLKKGVDTGKLSINYDLLGQNQTTRRYPISPGENVVKVIKKWSHYRDKIIFR